MQQLLHHSIFRPLPTGHGGEKHSYLLLVEAEQQGYTFHNLDLHRRDRLTMRRLWCAFCLLLRVYGVTRWLSLRDFLRQVRNIAYYYDQLIAFFRDSEEQVFLWESVRPEWYFLAFLARRYGKRVLAFPHNTESLVPKVKPYLFRMSRMRAFEWEMEVLRNCEEVYAVSHQETWLLRLYGVNAYYLPFYPVKECQEWLLQIRAAREQMIPKDKRTFLVVGSAINAPTAIGMQQLADYAAGHCLNVELRIGGYGTSQYIHIPNGCKNVVLLGELSQEQLTREMKECTALLINQPPTTGALTRIVEAEMAGIPVVANTDSMRNYFNIPGIYEYHTMDELQEVLQQELRMPQIPQKPNTHLFIEAIEKNQ